MDPAPGLRAPSRRTVTVLFTDVVGSTELAEALDPEVLRPALGAYFAACRTAIERHGGTVEKYIGDAVMAVFGIPAIHEDDALRAVRAALELHAAVEALAADLEAELGVSLQVRTGIQTGPVLAGGAGPGEPAATGDAVNTAARLQGVAPPGGIVLGDGCHRLVRAAVDAVALPPFELKGKARPVGAWLLRGLRAPAPVEGDPGHGLHGRATPLADLAAQMRAAIATGEPRAVAVVGEPGLGKSRLVAGFLASVPPATRIALTRVASYGESTFAPLGPLLAQVSGAPPGADAAAVLSRLERSLAGTVAAQEIGHHLAALLGLETTPVRTEEVSWAVRVVLDSVAHQAPLVLVVEDLHWAEPGLAALVGHLAASLRGPILLVVTTRPTDPESLGPGAGWTRLELDALDADASAAVVEQALDGPAEASLRARLVALGRGNPLFLEQLVATLRDDGRLEMSGGAWRASDELSSVSVPASVDALVAARFDRLGTDQRDLLEVLAVGGATVEGSVAAAILGATPEAHVTQSLSDTAFIDRPGAGGGLTWRHALVRDAVYGGVPKRRRAALHVAFADQAAGTDGSVPTELELRAGHHLEAAVGYRRELRLAGPDTDALARRGATHLGAAGRRAFMAADMPAAADLLARSAGLLPEDDPGRAALLPDLGKARLETGDPRARETIEEAVARTAAAGLTREHAQARLHRYVSAIWFERSVTGLAEREPLEAIAHELEAAGDPRGAALAWSAVAEVGWFTGDLVDAVAATETAARLALAAGDLWAWREYLALSVGDAWGEWPVEVAVARARAALTASGDHPIVAARALPVLGGGLAMAGDVTAGRPLVHRGVELAREVGLRIWEVEMAAVAGWFELMVGDPQAALLMASRAQVIAAAMGDRPHLAAAAGVLARACAVLGRDAEAVRWADVSHENRPSDTSPTETWWMTGLVDVHLRNGRTAEAEVLAARALAIAGEVDADRRASAELAMGEVREAQGRPDDARALRLSARGRYERLGYRLLMERIPADGGVDQAG